MNLYDIYQKEGFAGLKRLAEATESNPQYLRQCATGWRGKEPSPRLARRLIKADPRLTMDDIFGAPKPTTPREAA